MLSPIQIFSGVETNSQGFTTGRAARTFPIGLIHGPGIAGGNMIAASTANNNFKNDLTNYELVGKTIKKGETAYGLIGVNSYSYDAIRIKAQ